MNTSSQLSVTAVRIRDMSKTCSKCGVSQAADVFCRDASRADGLHPWCSGCRKSRALRYYRTERERYARNCRKWRREQPEKAKCVAARYRKSDARRRWLETNKEQIKAYQKTWRRTNRDKKRAHEVTRQAAIRSNGGVCRAADIRRMYAKQAGRCTYCASDLAVTGYHVDHVIPLKRGGSSDPGNLQLLCPPCNARKRDKMPADFAAERAS